MNASHFTDSSDLIDTGAGMRLRAHVSGSGPRTVLMLHGFPGLAYSWRHQMNALAQAGFRAIALDMPGYGGSDRPAELHHYTAERIRAYLLAVLDHYGIDRVIVVGQDFGAVHAWNLSVRSPERVAAVVATIPFDYDVAGRALLGSASAHRPGDPVPMACASPDGKPSERFAAMAQHHFVHLHYFQTVGPAERELGPAVRDYLQRSFYALSAQGDLWNWASVPSEGHGYLDALPPAPPLPWSWLQAQELDAFVEAYSAAEGDRRFIGGLSSYRAADIDWETGKRWADASITVPALMLYGEKDPAFGFFEDWAPRMQQRIPGLRGIVGIPDAGHLLQQERPAEFNAALLGFLHTL